MSKLLNISELITFKLEDDIFGIDIMITQEILEMQELRPIPNSPLYFEGMMDLRGEIIPIINFKKLFNFTYFDLGIEKNIILLEIDGQPFGVIIDQILRKVTIENKNMRQMGSLSKEIEKYVIGMIEYEEELISVLNIEAIFNLTNTQGIMAADSTDEYLVKQMAAYHTQFTQESQRKCIKTLQKIALPYNQVTWKESLNYILKNLIRKNIPIDKYLAQLTERIPKMEGYHNLNPTGKKILFDIDEDYYIFKSLLLESIVPEKRAVNDWVIRIWNLGDPSGSEAISLAILLYNFLPDRSKWDVKIVCSADNIQQLQKAATGKFDAYLLKRISGYDKDFFFQMEHNQFALKDLIKKWVIFDVRSSKNLDPPMEEVDLILARHYLSLIDNEHLFDVISCMVSSLRKEGSLILSEVEAVEDVYYDLTIQEINNRKYYIKH